MFDKIEYVDPAASKCGKCGCSFGVHLKTCSKFVQPIDYATPGTDLARWIWCRFVGIPITEPYDEEFRLLLLKIAAYTDEIKQRQSLGG